MIGKKTMNGLMNGHKKRNLHFQFSTIDSDHDLIFEVFINKICLSRSFHRFFDFRDKHYKKQDHFKPSYAGSKNVGEPRRDRAARSKVQGAV